MLEQLDRDIKSAMLGGDKTKAEILRGLKNALLNEAIRLGAKDSGLNDEQIHKVLAWEAKKRREAADLYQTAGETERAAKELAEKQVVDNYLPKQMSEAELKLLIVKHMTALGVDSTASMGKIIGAVKAEAGASADGALIARLVSETLKN